MLASTSSDCNKKQAKDRQQLYNLCIVYNTNYCKEAWAHMSAIQEQPLDLEAQDEFFTLSTDTLAKLVDPKSPDLYKELGGLEGEFKTSQCH